MDKRIFSPLTYWGGKSWLVKRILSLIPEGTKEIFSPFMGGGSIEINLAYRGYQVWGYDNYEPLVNFWNHWLTDPESVRLRVDNILSLYQNEDLNRLDYDRDWIVLLDKAAFYYIQNKLTFNGMPGGKIKQHFYRSDGEILRRTDCRKFPYGEPIFKNYEFWKSNPLSSLNVSCADFSEVFWAHSHQFGYFDPPYIGNEKGYSGSRDGFDHELLRRLLGESYGWGCSYGDHPDVYELYEGYRILEIQRCPSYSDGKKELLILSPDIAYKQMRFF